MENTVTEYKRELTDGFEREVVAFFNTIGGKISIGVDDSVKVVGLNNVDEIALKIADRLKNNILPTVMGLFNIDILEEDGKKYITVIVASGLEKPYYLKSYGMTPKGCFIRIGSQTCQMQQNMIDDLFSRRVSNTLHNVVSPNQALTFSQLKILYAETGHNVSGEYFLQNLDLFTDDGKYNYATYLMSDNNGSSIKVARFKGTEKIDILERNEFGQCCLIKSAKNVLEKLKLYNSMAVRVGGDAQRKQIPLIDEDALREAVLNAFIHNDYINGAYPVFEIYDDRIEIISSGGLPVGLSQNEFFAGRSLPRNKELMRIFFDLDMGEQLGMGMKKILSQYPKEIFEISEHFLSAKFMFNQDAMRILETQNVGVTKTENEILDNIQKKPEITLFELAKILDKTDRTILCNINTLKKKGIIERVGSDKTGFWKIK